MDGTKEKSPMAMTKADIVEALYEKVGFSKKKRPTWWKWFSTPSKAPSPRETKSKFRDSETSWCAKKRSRVGRNPQTGETIEISARRVLTFRPSQVLRAEVNSSLEGKPIDPNTVHHGSEDDDDDAE